LSKHCFGNIRKRSVTDLYHLYQGLPEALSHIPAFWLFSLYFVRTRRILPVILAHMWMDVSALALHFRHLH